MKFVNFIGNEKVKEQLAFLTESKRLPHALIIAGEHGLGKHTLAKEIALNLFCRGEETPCLECAQCSKVLKDIHPDLYEYTAPDRASGFHIDKVREIIKDTYVKPNEADYKIYILGNAQSMNLNAQNALLKVLEEPPAYAIFILTVTNKASLLETVLSRSVVINLEGVECSAGADYITAHNEDVSYSDAYKALEIWGGNIGKAQDSLNDGKLQKISETADALARGVIADSEYELVKTCSVFVRNNAFLASVLVLTKSIFRDAMFINSDSVSAQRETAELLASRLSRKKLLRLCEACDSLRYMAERNANNPILISKVSSDFRRAVGR